jgi:hypothetical protein
MKSFLAIIALVFVCVVKPESALSADPDYDYQWLKSGNCGIFKWDGTVVGMGTYQDCLASGMRIGWIGKDVAYCAELTPGGVFLRTIRINPCRKKFGTRLGWIDRRTLSCGEWTMAGVFVGPLASDICRAELLAPPK